MAAKKELFDCDACGAKIYEGIPYTCVDIKTEIMDDSTIEIIGYAEVIFTFCKLHDMSDVQKRIKFI